MHILGNKSLLINSLRAHEFHHQYPFFQLKILGTDYIINYFEECG